MDATKADRKDRKVANNLARSDRKVCEGIGRYRPSMPRTVLKFGWEKKPTREFEARMGLGAYQRGNRSDAAAELQLRC